MRLPLVGRIASSGADILAGVSATYGWGKAARAIVRCSGIVPVILTVDGPAVSGPALFLGLADVVVMTETSYAFVSGPHMVREFTGETLTNTMLGGPGMHARTSGVAVTNSWAVASGAITVPMSRPSSTAPEACDAKLR